MKTEQDCGMHSLFVTVKNEPAFTLYRSPGFKSGR